MTARACSIMTNEEQNENENEKGKQELGIHTSAKRRRHCEKYVLSNEGVFWQLFINSFCMHSFASLFGNSLGSLSFSLSLSHLHCIKSANFSQSTLSLQSERGLTTQRYQVNIFSVYFYIYIYICTIYVCLPKLER